MSSAPPTTAPLRASRPQRLTAAAIVAVSLSGLLVGAFLRPDSTGASTHEQLGLPPCGMLLVTGIPCPSCGMTTAVSLAADGRLVKSFLTQPFGMLFALSAAIGFWAGLHVAVCGARVYPFAARLLRPRLAWPVAAAWLLSWVYKVATWTA